MAHRLLPAADHDFLPVEDTLTRLREVCGFVDADAEYGAEHVGALIAQLERIAATGQAPAHVEDHVASLKEALATAVYVTLRAEKSAAAGELVFPLVESQPIFVEYDSGCSLDFGFGPSVIADLLWPRLTSPLPSQQLVLGSAERNGDLPG